MQLIEWVYIGIFGIMLFSTNLWLVVYLFNRKKVNSDPKLECFPSITFLVPAYNEEDHIEDCLDSLLAMEYPEDKMEIFAINDGSKDSTLEKMKQYSDEITIIDKENSGKASSMNYALEKVETELVASMDGDSQPRPDYLKRMVTYFQEDGVTGVTPTMKVENPETWAQRVIWMEYIYNLFLRKLFSIFDAQFVMPGPGSVYDTDHLKEIGGWDEETLTEDMEVVFRMIENGAKIRNSTNAFVDTHAPRDMKGLFRQRSRWYRGNLNNAIRYRNVFFNPKFGNFGMIVLPFNLIWAGLVLFIFTHFGYRISSSLFNFAADIATYGLNFGMPSLTVQSLSLFHIFNLTLGVMGLFMVSMSLYISESRIKSFERKIDVVFFFIFYAFLYSSFWIKALIDKARNEEAW